MTPEDKKLITVLTRLYAKTKADVVEWEPSEDANIFAVKFSDYTKRCRDMAQDDNGFIVPLVDADIVKMLTFIAAGNKDRATRMAICTFTK
jgi:hypothetical protein